MTESYDGHSDVCDTYDWKPINVAWSRQAHYDGLPSERQRAASLNEWAALDRLRRLNKEAAAGQPVISAGAVAVSFIVRVARSLGFSGLVGQTIFRLELGKDDKVVNEEAVLTDLNERIRDARVLQDGAVYPPPDR